MKPAACSIDACASTSVLIADHHHLVRAGLSSIIINSAPGLCVVAQAVDGASTLEQLASRHFGLLTLDLSMPPPCGIELIAMVRQRHPNQRILVVTTHTNVRVVSAALAAGANGFITKDSNPEMFIHAVRLVASGGCFVEPRLAQTTLFHNVSAQQQRITPRETDILRGLAAGQSNVEIAKKLHLSEKTVSTHKANCMAKLGLRNIADLLRYADENLLFETSPAFRV
jgi:DNA-binding NarL/FixJ family response regulator